MGIVPGQTSSRVFCFCLGRCCCTIASMEDTQSTPTEREVPSVSNWTRSARPDLERSRNPGLSLTIVSGVPIVNHPNPESPPPAFIESPPPAYDDAIKQQLTPAVQSNRRHNTYLDH